MDWKKFLFSFDGRVGRKAYWLFLVAVLVIFMGIQFAALGPMIAAEIERRLGMMLGDAPLLARCLLTATSLGGWEGGVSGTARR